MKTLTYASAFALLLALGSGAGQVRAQDAICDMDSNGLISASEAEDCADRDYTSLLGDNESMDEESFMSTYENESFTEIDADADGVVSREEYVGWRNEEFTGALGGSEEMPTADYEGLDRAGVLKSQGADDRTPGGGSDDNGTQ